MRKGDAIPPAKTPKGPPGEEWENPIRAKMRLEQQDTAFQAAMKASPEGERFR